MLGIKERMTELLNSADIKINGDPSLHRGQQIGVFDGSMDRKIYFPEFNNTLCPSDRFINRWTFCIGKMGKSRSGLRENSDGMVQKFS